MNRRLLEFKLEVISRIETVIGSSISYESISPSIFRFLEIRKLQITADTDQGPQIIEINRVRALYNVIPLFSGKIGEALKEIRIENSRFDIDADRDSQLIEFVTGIIRGREGESSDNPVLISGKNLELRLKNNNGEMTLSRVFFDLNVGNNELEIKSKGIGVANSYNAALAVTRIETGFSLNGTLGRGLDWSNITFTVNDVDTDILRVHKLTANIQLNASELKFRKIQDKSPFDLSFTYLFDKKELSGAFVSDGFIPARVFEPKTNDSILRSWFEAEITGDSSGYFNLDSSNVGYEGDLKILVPKRIADRVLPNDLGNAQIQTHMRFRGDENNVSLFPFSLVSDLGNINFNGNLDIQRRFPEGRFTVRNLVYPFQDRPIDADFTMQTDENKLDIFGGMRFGRQLLGDMRAVITLNSGNVNFQTSGFVDTQDEKFSLAGEWSERHGIDLSGNIQNVHLKSLVMLIGKFAPDALDTYKVDAEYKFKNGPGGMDFTVAPVRISSDETPDTFADFEVSGSDSGYNLQVHRAQYNEVSLHGMAAFDRYPKGDGTFLSQFEVNENQYNLEGLLWDGEKLAFSGSYGIEGLLYFGKNISFSIRGNDVPFPVSSENTILLSLVTSGKMGPNDWRIDVDACKIAHFPLAENSFSFSGSIDQKGVSLPSIVWEDAVSPLEGRGYISMDVTRFIDGITDPENNGAYLDGWLTFTAEEEEYLSHLVVSSNQIEGSIIFNGANLKRIPRSGLGGKLSGNTDISGTLTDPVVAVSLKLDEGELNSDPLGLALKARYENRTFNLEEVNVSYLGGRIDKGFGKFSYDTGDITFVSELALAFRDNRIRGKVTIDGSVSVNDDTGISDIAEEDFVVSAALSDLVFQEEALEPWNFVFQRNQGILSFLGGPENSVTGSLANNGSFTLDLKEPFPIRLHGEGSIQKGNIDAEFSNLTFLVAELQSILKHPFFSLYDGTIYGERMTIRGPFNDPEIYGRLTARNLWATSRVIPELIGPFQADLRISEREIIASKLFLPVGSSSVNADIYFGMDHWFPQSYSVSLSTGEDQTIHLASRIGKIEFDGRAKGNILISGDNIGIDIKADLIADSTLVTLSNEAYERKDPSSYLVSTDISLTTGKGVEFLWPYKNLPILRTFAETGQKIRIKTNSLDSSLSLRGEIVIRGGEIVYFQRNFYLKSGKIVFNEDQFNFDPILTARAEIRESGEQGEDVKIFLIVDEKPFSQFSPRFESSPVYSEFQIAQILGGSVFSSVGGNEEMDLTAALLTTEGLVEQFVVVRNFENAIKNFLDLDLFTLRTQIIQRALLDKMVAEPNPDDTIQSSLGRYLDNTSLIGGKYLLDDLFIQMMLQVRSNEEFLREFGGDVSYYLDTEVDLEWQTPFFLLEMAFFPKSDLISSVLDTRVGLSWRFSF